MFPFTTRTAIAGRSMELAAGAKLSPTPTTTSNGRQTVRAEQRGMHGAQTRLRFYTGKSITWKIVFSLSWAQRLSAEDMLNHGSSMPTLAIINISHLLSVTFVIWLTIFYATSHRLRPAVSSHVLVLELRRYRSLLSCSMSHVVHMASEVQSRRLVTLL